MKNNVTQTSIDCYHDNAAHFEGIKGKILGAMSPGQKYTRREISVMCNIDYSCASGRVKDLIDDGLIVVCDKDYRGYKKRSVELIRLKSAEES